jgi:hypothetical protein
MRRKTMTRKKQRLVYDPLYRLKPVEEPARASRKEKTRMWTAVVRILSFGWAGK